MPMVHLPLDRRQLKNRTERHKAVVDITPSPQWAVPPPHRLHPEIFRILFALAWHTQWSRLLHDVIGDWMIPVAANATVTLQRRLSMLLNGSHNPQKLPLPFEGSAFPSYTWFRGLTRVFWQNGMSIDSAVFAQHTVVSHYFTMGRYVFPKKLPLTHGRSSPPCNTWY